MIQSSLVIITRELRNTIHARGAARPAVWFWLHHHHYESGVGWHNYNNNNNSYYQYDCRRMTSSDDKNSNENDNENNVTISVAAAEAASAPPPPFQRRHRYGLWKASYAYMKGVPNSKPYEQNKWKKVRPTTLECKDCGQVIDAMIGTKQTIPVASVRATWRSVTLIPKNEADVTADECAGVRPPPPEEEMEEEMEPIVPTAHRPLARNKLNEQKQRQEAERLKIMLRHSRAFTDNLQMQQEAAKAARAIYDRPLIPQSHRRRR